MKYRIVHASGWVEFAHEAAAIVYRDEHHPGSPIITLPLDPPGPLE